MFRTPARFALASSVALVLFTGAARLGPGAVVSAPDLRARAELPSVDTAILNRYKWRNAGPDRGGRSIAVSGVKGRPLEGYFGATGGGLWKTNDGGTSWAPVTDGQLTTSSVGAVAVAETNPDIVFIGTGESCIRGNIEPGDGVYKSSDAGKTWAKVGFSGSDAISRIRIDPTNPDIVFVADFGKYSVPSEERGVFKSTDGGKTWRRVLFKDANTGAVDISIDRANPRIIYAALWEAYRKEYQMSSGGPGSGLYKSTDGGETWTELTRNSGLPAGLDGKIGVAVSGADGNRVYALIENENGGLYRSNDAGATWTMVNDSRNIRQRAFYFTHVFADPKNADQIYLLNVSSYSSVDGGKTLTNLRAAHSDSHDLWVDPDNPQHMLAANDGGGSVSTTGGAAWSPETYSTAQLYHVASTAKLPPDLCGAQQDDATICVEFGTPLGAAAGGRGGRGGGGGAGGGGRGGPAAPTTYGAGGAEPGYIAPDPKDPDIFYAGGNNGSFLTKLNRRTGEELEVSPYPRMFSGEESAILVERWQWTYPIVFSPVNPNVLYTGSQHLWKTTNGGHSWVKLGGDAADLTRHDPKTMGPSGGPITRDMNGPEVYGVIFAIGPSKRTTNIIWTGSDDGQIHVTRDGGTTWSNVTPKDMPDFGRVSIIDASAFDSATAYAAVKRPLLDDRAPYIFRTHDFGKTWTKIVTGIRSDDYAQSVREDPTRRGLLYAGTEHGFYISYDDGDHWASLSINLPDVQVSDIEVLDNSIAISTMGRGFYILDDIGPLRQYTPAMTEATDVVLFAPPVAVRSVGGAQIMYWVKKPVQSIAIDVLDGKGAVVHSFAPAAGGGRAGGGGGGGRGGRGGGAGPSLAPGFNSVTWNLQYPPASSFPGMILWGGGTQGPMAAPGKYTVRLTVDGRTMTQPLVVKRYVLHDATDADLQEQFDLAIQIRDKVTEANDAVIQIRAIKAQIADRLAKSQDPKLKIAGDKFTADLSNVEQDIYQVRNQSGEDPLNFPIRVNNRLASLLENVELGDMRPIANAAPIFHDLVGELKVRTDRLKAVLTTELPAFNVEAKRVGVDVVSAK